MKEEPERVVFDGRTQREKDEDFGCGLVVIAALVILLLGALAVGCWYLAGSLGHMSVGTVLVILLLVWFLGQRGR